MSRTHSARSAVLVPILCVVIGLVLGLAVGIVPRFFNFDPMRLFKSEAVTLEKAEPGEKKIKADAVQPKEVELRRMIADVTKQRALLEEREKPLTARTAQLEQERKALEEMKLQMDAIEARMKKSSIEMDINEQKNIKRLAKMWAQMEPTEVVSLVKGLDLELAAKVISTMQERAAAPILGAMASAADGGTLAPDLVQKLRQIKQASEVASTSKKETR